MCVIVSCDRGKYPDANIIRQCRDSNSDGNGFAYVEDGVVHYEKGATLQRCLEVTRYCEKNDLPLVLHFRIATIGAVTKELCHPFPTDDPNSARLDRRGTAGEVLFHNGSTRSATRMARHSIAADGKPDITAPKGNSTDWSDSRALALLTARYGPLFLKDEAQTNRFVLLKSDGTFQYYGTWRDHQGMRFSNMSWNYVSYGMDMHYRSGYYPSNGWSQSGSLKRKNRPNTTRETVSDRSWTQVSNLAEDVRDIMRENQLTLSIDETGQLHLAVDCDDDDPYKIRDIDGFYDAEDLLVNWKMMPATERVITSRYHVSQRAKKLDYLVDVAVWLMDGNLSVSTHAGARSFKYRMEWVPSDDRNRCTRYYREAEHVNQGVADLYRNWFIQQDNPSPDARIVYHILVNGEDLETTHEQAAD